MNLAQVEAQLTALEAQVSALEAELGATKEMLRGHEERLSRRAQRLAYALEKQIANCGLCHGKGTWESRCGFCDDSTHDHICATDTYPCDQCAEARAVLAEGYA